MKEIFDVPVQGFCGGVSHAIQTALKAIESGCPQPVTVLGSLVHNRFVNAALEEKGLRILEAKGRTRLDLLDTIDSGTVIFTAHGVSKEVRTRAAEKHLHVIDASCPFVLSTQKLMDQKLKEGCTIFYCGKKGHPEAEGAVGTSDRVLLIESEADLPLVQDGKIFVTNQTTMSVADLDSLFQTIHARFPQAEFCNEICNATRIRQQAVSDLKDRRIDLLIVVGDPASNNTRKLSATGLQAGIPDVLQAECLDDLRSEQNLARIEKADRIALTSGASTPSWLKDEILQFLNSFESSDPA